ncbi:MAG: hypothetical protein COV72_01860 [Candidatus Omnitrophica bacterium CG11_big_fil_rev_8_21_14_0_20_42_13]|uniref:AsmA domain-containing protein n=1 Tax=Candidatus Ghiorseimicrobium undicola TaxID=1974746 RepID=A0A2H0M187_9BACT|nr:MAG: hypothetical protein COV72_01860 [Candidatus Omnitrophica bacterium CG11_big_fil_rev_8_21_14_0_20_42_13]
MKRMFVAAIVLAVAILGLVFAKNLIARALIIQGGKAMTGLRFEVKNADLGILKTYLTLRELKVMNPEGFDDRVMAYLPRVQVDYNLADFFEGKAHFEELAVDLEELVVVINADNRVNVKSLQALSPKGGKEQVPLIIDTMRLKIGKVVYKNYAFGAADAREFKLNIEEDFSNIEGADALVGLILMRALSKTNVPALAGIDMGAIKEKIVADVMRQSEGMLQEFKTKTQEKIQEIFQP